MRTATPIDPGRPRRAAGSMGPQGSRRAALAVLVLALGLGLGLTTWAADPGTTILLVRHAEKQADAGRDPGLTPEGIARAEALAHVAGGSGVAAIYVTEYRRTQDTVAPLAKVTGVEPTEVGAREMDKLVERLQAGAPGKTIVVSGHSNTIPRIVQALTGVETPDLDEKVYDTLFVVHLDATGAATATRLRFGAPHH